MSDREAPTPRLTSTWSIHEERAHQLSETLSAAAQAEREDVLRSKRLRDASGLAELWARTFRRWSTEHVAAPQKVREHDGFRLFVAAADAELAT